MIDLGQRIVQISHTFTMQALSMHAASIFFHSLHTSKWAGLMRTRIMHDLPCTNIFGQSVKQINNFGNVAKKLHLSWIGRRKQLTLFFFSRTRKYPNWRRLDYWLRVGRGISHHWNVLCASIPLLSVLLSLRFEIKLFWSSRSVVK